jgi:large subunit ribosomal protein L25
VAVRAAARPRPLALLGERVRDPHGPADRLAGRPAIAARKALVEAAMFPQTHTGGEGIGQRETAAGKIVRPQRPAWMVAPAVVGAAVRRSWRSFRRLTKRRDHEHEDARQTEEMNSGDPQQQLSLARHTGSLARREGPEKHCSLPSIAVMATSQTTALKAASREPSGSRAVRRLRREGLVPGVIYGGGEDPVSFAVDARALRIALSDAGAVLDLSIDGASGSPVVVKELVRHPVTGHTTHLDLLRVRLDIAIQATVTLELTGFEDSPASRDGGVLEQITRELTVEALPTSIPDVLTHDVAAAEIGDTVTLDALTASGAFKIIGEDETVIATVSAPRLQLESDTEIEAETEVVGEGGAAAEAEGGEAAEQSGDDSSSSDE